MQPDLSGYLCDDITDDYSANGGRKCEGGRECEGGNVGDRENDFGNGGHDGNCD